MNAFESFLEEYRQGQKITDEQNFRMMTVCCLALSQTIKKRTENISVIVFDKQKALDLASAANVDTGNTVTEQDIDKAERLLYSLCLNSYDFLNDYEKLICGEN